MATPSFTPTANVALAAGTASANVAIPTTGSPTEVIVTNFGPAPAFVALGGAGVAASVAGGTPVLPQSSIALALGANTELAAITASGTAALRITAAT